MSVFTEDKQLKTEGYLADKWGTTLVSGHRFENRALLTD